MRLLLEAAQTIGIRGEGRKNNLYRHVTAKGLVMCAIDDAHATRAYRARMR
jgi:hypothetical protein